MARHGVQRAGERIATHHALRIQRHHLARQLQTFTVVLEIEQLRHYDAAPTQEAFVRFDVRRSTLFAIECHHVELDAQRARHIARDLILHREYVRQYTRVSLRPKVGAIIGANELCSDTQLIARFAHTAFQYVSHAELLADDAQVFVLALERETGRATDDPQSRHLRQMIENFFRQTVGEVLLITRFR